MFAGVLGLIAFYGSNVPCWDDWDIVPSATRHQPITLQWLWSQHNEHRVPIPRLLLLGILRLSRIDFRAGMVFNALATAALALALMVTARTVRGRSIFCDAFFPIVLLGWGQAVNFLWCWQVQFFSSMALSGTVLVFAARSAGPPRLWLGMLIGLCVILLPLCGANGVGLTPALALWLGYAALLHWRRGTHEGKRAGLILFGAALIAVMLVAVYFIGYRSVPYHPSTHRPQVVVRTIVQFLTIGFGPGLVGLGFPTRVPQPFWKLIGCAVVALYIVTAAALLRRWWQEPGERSRTAALFLFLAAIGSLAVGLGMGRDGFETRYLTLSVPGICAIYLAWSFIGTGRWRARISLALFVTALVALPGSVWWGWHYARDLRSRLAVFESDMRGGMAPYQLTERHSYLHPHHMIMMDYMPMLREASVGAFAHLSNNPPFTAIDVPLSPVETYDVAWQDGIARKTGKHEALTFALPREVDAAGIRLRYAFSNPSGTEPYVAIYWKGAKETEFGPESFTKYSPTGDRANWRAGTWSRLRDPLPTMEAWVCHPVQTIQIRPALGHGMIKLDELAVLVPSAQALGH